MRTGCRVVWVWRRPTAVAAAARTAASFSSCAAARPGRSKHLSMICLLSSLVKKTIVHCINHLPSYLVECRLYEPSETSGPTNGDRSSSLRVATSPSCKRFLKNISAFMSESEPRGWLYLPSPTGKPPEASSRCGVGGSGVEALSDPERINFPISPIENVLTSKIPFLQLLVLP